MSEVVLDLIERSPHLKALIQVKKLIGSKHSEIAKVLKISDQTVSAHIGKNPKYFLTVGDIEDYLDLFERHRSGSRQYYYLLLSGFNEVTAEKLAFTPEYNRAKDLIFTLTAYADSVETNPDLVSPEQAEELVYAALKMNARPEVLGQNISPTALSGLLQGFSERMKNNSSEGSNPEKAKLGQN